MSLYVAINYTSDYLEGKDFEPVSNDYRYFYYDDTEELETSLAEMPYWYLILTIPLWGT